MINFLIAAVFIIRLPRIEKPEIFYCEPSWTRILIETCESSFETETFSFVPPINQGKKGLKGKTKEYYSTAAASIGLQLGAQSKSIILVFLSGKALADFRKSDGWKAGVDGSVAVVKWGTGKDINTIDIKDPIVGFVFGNKGLMYNLTIEGSKFSKIKR